MIKKAKYYFVELRHKIKKLIDWISIIWQDYDWDYSYLLKILHKKLEYMESHFYTYNSNLTAKKIKRITVCKNLCKRLIEDDYVIKNNKCKNLIAIREYDKELLFKYMQKYVDTWWD